MLLGSLVKQRIKIKHDALQDYYRVKRKNTS